MGWINRSAGQQFDVVLMKNVKLIKYRGWHCVGYFQSLWHMIAGSGEGAGWGSSSPGSTKVGWV